MTWHDAALLAGLGVVACGVAWIAFSVWTYLTIASLRRTIGSLRVAIDHLGTEQREEDLKASFHQRLADEIERGVKGARHGLEQR